MGMFQSFLYVYQRLIDMFFVVPVRKLGKKTVFTLRNGTIHFDDDVMERVGTLVTKEVSWGI